MSSTSSSTSPTGGKQSIATILEAEAKALDARDEAQTSRKKALAARAEALNAHEEALNEREADLDERDEKTTAEELAASAAGRYHTHPVAPDVFGQQAGIPFFDGYPGIPFTGMSEPLSPHRVAELSKIYAAAEIIPRFPTASGDAGPPTLANVDNQRPGVTPAQHEPVGSSYAELMRQNRIDVMKQQRAEGKKQEAEAIQGESEAQKACKLLSATAIGYEQQVAEVEAELRVPTLEELNKEWSQAGEVVVEETKADTEMNGKRGAKLGMLLTGIFGGGGKESKDAETSEVAGEDESAEADAVESTEEANDNEDTEWVPARPKMEQEKENVNENVESGEEGEQDGEDTEWDPPRSEMDMWYQAEKWADVPANNSSGW